MGDTDRVCHDAAQKVKVETPEEDIETVVGQEADIEVGP